MRKVPLTWENGSCDGPILTNVRNTFQVKKTTGFYPRLQVDTARCSAAGQAGGVLLTEAIRVSGLGPELSAALAAWRKPTAVHDPAKIVLDLAVTLALGGDCLADIALLRAEPGVYGRVASDPTVSRTIDVLAADAEASLKAIDTARAAARARVWALAGDHAPGPGHRRRAAADHGCGRHPGRVTQREGEREAHVQEGVRVPSGVCVRRPRSGRDRGAAADPVAARERRLEHRRRSHRRRQSRAEAAARPSAGDPAGSQGAGPGRRRRLDPRLPRTG